MNPLSETARAKINLTLRVAGRRDDGYHELESLVTFADIADTLTLDVDATLSLEVGGPFAAASGSTADNLVLKAHRELAVLVPSLKAGRFHLDKHIPVAAGIGGGSADAAAALRLLALVNDLPFDDARLMTAALRTGADVPVCLASQACIMAGIGERLSPRLDLPPLHAVLVNPRVALATKDVFAARAKLNAPNGDTGLGEIPRGAAPLIAFLGDHGNDLTDAAIACAPVVGDVLAALRALPGVQLARMSGSGATCFGIFSSRDEAQRAVAEVSLRRPDWWVAPAVLHGAPGP